MQRYLGLVFALLAGCATYNPIPDGFTGPLATIRDTGYSQRVYEAHMFVVVAIDGHPIHNSLHTNTRANASLVWSVPYVSREVPVRTMRLTLRGTQVFDSLARTIFGGRADIPRQVEGTVEFTPLPGGTYSVRGELTPSGSAVWIEETSTYVRVTPKVIAK